MAGADYLDVKEAVWDELKNHHRPEFLNRIDETVVFRSRDASPYRQDRSHYNSKFLQIDCLEWILGYGSFSRVHWKNWLR
jgi:hypothetical protein